MPAPLRAEIPRRARETVRDYGRSFVVVIEGRDEPHYGFVDELRNALADEEEAMEVVLAAEGPWPSTIQRGRLSSSTR